MLGKVEVINSSCNDKTLIQTLILIHKDIMQNKKVCMEYYEKKIIEGLVARLVSCEKNMALALSVSLLNLVFTCGSPFKESIIHLEALEDILLELIEIKYSKDQNEESKRNMTLIYQEILKLLINLTRISKYQIQLASKGLFEKLIKMLKYGSQLDACFSDDARTFMRGMIVGRKLVGKIDPQQSSILKKGVLSILSVDLFDTTSSKDININQLLVEEKYAWNDLTEDTKPQVNKDEEMWCDFYVTKLVDANSFWALIDNEAQEKIKSMSLAIEDHIYSSDVCSLKEVDFGQKVCCHLGTVNKDLKWCRGCVLEVGEGEDTECLILLVDHGFIVKSSVDHLYFLPEQLASLPHQAKLCILRNVKAPPSNTSCLQLTLELLCNLTSKGHNFRMQLHQLGLTPIITKLCQSHDKAVVLRAMALLGNLALNFNIRAQIGCTDVAKVISEKIRRYADDNGALKVLLGALINLIVESSQNRKKMASEDILLILMTVYRMPHINDENKALVTKAMKNLIGDGWRMLDPINVTDVREMSDGNIDKIKGCFNLTNLCGDELLEEVKKRRNHKIMKRGLREHEALPDPTYMSISMDDLVRKLGGSGGISSSDQDATDRERISKNSETLTGDESDDGYDGYVFKRRLDILENESNCFMLERNLSKVKAVDIGDTVVAFLNSKVAGTIYIGVNRVGIIVGVNVIRKERDNLRLGVDDLMQKCSPIVTYNMFEINFSPVMIKNAQGIYEQYEERYVVEIKVNKNSSGTIYQTPAMKMYFRKNAANIQYTVQEIREKTVAEEEAKYKAEIRALQMMIEEAKNRKKSKIISSQS